MAKKVFNFAKTRIFMLIIGVVLGAAVVLGARFARYQPPKEVHYHANFAIYINGQRQKLDNPLLYEEIEVCSAGKAPTPSERAHLHDMVNDVVHIEDDAVTWGHFFQNIRYGLGEDYIGTTKQVYMADDQNKVTFILNGEKVTSLANRIINDKDRLLVDYGNASDEELTNRFNLVPSTAAKYDASSDPKSCGAKHGDRSIMSRWRHMF